MTIPYVSTLFAQSDRSRSLSPDSPTNSMSSLRPELGFVLCRNSEGQATAVYGDDEWDFNPYRLSAKKINIIKFKSIFRPRTVVKPLSTRYCMTSFMVAPSAYRVKLSSTTGAVSSRPAGWITETHTASTQIGRAHV